MLAEIKSCPPSGPTGLYFPYNWQAQGYDMSSFRLEYSGGRIGEDDCKNLLLELNSFPLIQQSKTVKKSAGFLCIGFLIMFLILPLYIGTAFPYIKAEVGNAAGIMGLGIGIISFAGFITLITSGLVLAKMMVQRTSTIKRIVGAIIKRHNDSSLIGKQAMAMASPHMGYIYIQFLWVAQQMLPVNPMMNPMMVGAMM